MSTPPRVVLGVAGGIAAYKACLLLRLLTETGHGGHVDLAGHGQDGHVPALFDFEPQIHGLTIHLTPQLLDRACGRE